MLKTYVLVRDHLEQAQAILSIEDPESRTLQKALRLMIGVIDDMQHTRPRRASNIIDFAAAAARRPPDE